MPRPPPVALEYFADYVAALIKPLEASGKLSVERRTFATSATPVTWATSVPCLNHRAYHLRRFLISNPCDLGNLCTMPEPPSISPAAFSYLFSCSGAFCVSCRRRHAKHGSAEDGFRRRPSDFDRQSVVSKEAISTFSREDILRASRAARPAAGGKSFSVTAEGPDGLDGKSRPVLGQSGNIFRPLFSGFREDSG